MLPAPASDVAYQCGLNEWTAAQERGRMLKERRRGCIFCPPPYIMCSIWITGEICFVMRLRKINASIPLLCIEADSQIVMAKA